MGIAIDTFELIVSADGDITGGAMYPTRTIAKLFGVTDRHIQQLTKDGVLPATETPSGRQYDLVPTIQAYIRYLRDAAHGKTGSEREQELKQQKLEADIALKGTQNELHRLKMDIAAGKYIPVTDYQLKALQSLMPPEDLTVSQWAEKYRMLDYETEEIVLCKSAQLGGTEAILNALGYIVQQDPSPTMVVYPSDVLAESISKNRIIPMVQASPTLRERYQPFESKKLELQFDGMYLSLVGSNSPSNLASKAIRFLFLDEVDKYPGASAKEADPIALARERTKTFQNRKIFITSTPTITTGHVWKSLQGCDVEKHYFVPCPHCGKMIELKWSQVKFPDGEGMSYADRAEMAMYVCPECGAIITDQHKPQMLRQGEWRTVKENTPYHRKVGFWINILYSPFVRFSDVVREFLASKDDPEKLQNFVNSWLAEPWEDTNLKTSADLVYDFCATNSEWALPSKGASTKMYTHYRMSKVNKPTSRAYGMDLVLVDTDKYKDMIAGRRRSL